MKVGTASIRGGAPCAVGYLEGRDTVVDIARAAEWLGLVGEACPTTTLGLLQLGRYGQDLIADVGAELQGVDLEGVPWAAQRADVQLLAPVKRPGKLVCITSNRGHRPLEATTPESQDEWPHPLFFLKAPNAVAPTGVTVAATESMRPLEVEGEIALVIGRRAKAVSVADAAAYVAGVTLLIDMASGRFMDQDASIYHIARGKGLEPELMYTRPVARGKGVDGFCPMGPWITPLSDLSGTLDDVRLTTRVDEDVVQDGKMSSHRFTAEYCLSYVSRWLTFEPGDILSLGAVDQSPEFPMRDVDLVADGGRTVYVDGGELGELVAAGRLATES
jgi:2-keto-4-pentenoate hydratase/2-oxohepta-3-ene-1,7-dioic acid hydratase in catechol pathway